MCDDYDTDFDSEHEDCWTSDWRYDIQRINLALGDDSDEPPEDEDEDEDDDEGSTLSRFSHFRASNLTEPSTSTSTVNEVPDSPYTQPTDVDETPTYTELKTRSPSNNEPITSLSTSLFIDQQEPAQTSSLNSLPQETPSNWAVGQELYNFANAQNKEFSSDELEENISDTVSQFSHLDRQTLQLCLTRNREYQTQIMKDLRIIETSIADNRKKQIDLTQVKYNHEADDESDLKTLPSLQKFSSPYFKDSHGNPPPDNEDARHYRSLMAISAYEKKPITWNKTEKELLAEGVRMQNLKAQLTPFLIRLNELENQQGVLYNYEEIQRVKQEINAIKSIPPKALEEGLDNIDWDKLSCEYLSRRSPIECKLEWCHFGHPRVNRTPWTKDEDKMLLNLSKEKDYLNWNEIAQAMQTNRTPIQCFKRYQRSLNKEFIRSKWTPEEDKQLIELVKALGMRNWARIADFMEGRLGEQCMHRYMKAFMPNKKGRWSDEESQKLKEAVEKIGKNWEKVSEYVPGRTGTQCRERYVNIVDPNLNKGVWNAEEDEKLLNLVDLHGEGNWSKIAKDLGPRTDNQCWRRWTVLRKKEAADYRLNTVRKKKEMVLHFAGRKKERPTLSPKDLDIEDIPIVLPSSRKKTEKPKTEGQRPDKATNSPESNIEKSSKDVKPVIDTPVKKKKKYIAWSEHNYATPNNKDGKPKKSMLTQTDVNNEGEELSGNQRKTISSDDEWDDSKVSIDEDMLGTRTSSRKKNVQVSYKEKNERDIYIEEQSNSGDKDVVAIDSDDVGKDDVAIDTNDVDKGDVTIDSDDVGKDDVAIDSNDVDKDDVTIDTNDVNENKTKIDDTDVNAKVDEDAVNEADTRDVIRTIDFDYISDDDDGTPYKYGIKNMENDIITIDVSVDKDDVAVQKNDVITIDKDDISIDRGEVAVHDNDVITIDKDDVSIDKDDVTVDNNDVTAVDVVDLTANQYVFTVDELGVPGAEVVISGDQAPVDVQRGKETLNRSTNQGNRGRKKGQRRSTINEKEPINQTEAELEFVFLSAPIFPKNMPKRKSKKAQNSTTRKRKTSKSAAVISVGTPTHLPTPTTINTLPTSLTNTNTSVLTNSMPTVRTFAIPKSSTISVMSPNALPSSNPNQGNTIQPTTNMGVGNVTNRNMAQVGLTSTVPMNSAVSIDTKSSRRRRCKKNKKTPPIQQANVGPFTLLLQAFNINVTAVLKQLNPGLYSSPSIPQTNSTQNTPGNMNTALATRTRSSVTPVAPTVSPGQHVKSRTKSTTQPRTGEDSSIGVMKKICSRQAPKLTGSPGVQTLPLLNPTDVGKCHETSKEDELPQGVQQDDIPSSKNEDNRTISSIVPTQSRPHEGTLSMSGDNGNVALDVPTLSRSHEGTLSMSGANGNVALDVPALSRSHEGTLSMSGDNWNVALDVPALSRSHEDSSSKSGNDRKSHHGELRTETTPLARLQSPEVASLPLSPTSEKCNHVDDTNNTWGNLSSPRENEPSSSGITSLHNDVMKSPQSSEDIPKEFRSPSKRKSRKPRKRTSDSSPGLRPTSPKLSETPINKTKKPEQNQRSTVATRPSHGRAFRAIPPLPPTLTTLKGLRNILAMKEQLQKLAAKVYQSPNTLNKKTSLPRENKANEGGTLNTSTNETLGNERTTKENANSKGASNVPPTSKTEVKQSTPLSDQTGNVIRTQDNEELVVVHINADHVPLEPHSQEQVNKDIRTKQHENTTTMTDVGLEFSRSLPNRSNSHDENRAVTSTVLPRGASQPRHSRSNTDPYVKFSLYRKTLEYKLLVARFQSLFLWPMLMSDVAMSGKVGSSVRDRLAHSSQEQISSQRLHTSGQQERGLGNVIGRHAIHVGPSQKSSAHASSMPSQSASKKARQPIKRSSSKSQKTTVAKKRRRIVVDDDSTDSDSDDNDDIDIYDDDGNYTPNLKSVRTVAAPTRLLRSRKRDYKSSSLAEDETSDSPPTKTSNVINTQEATQEYHQLNSLIFVLSEESEEPE